MTTDLDRIPTTASVDLAADADGARRYVANAVAANTRRAYASDLRVFVDYCNGRGLVAIPASPETVAAFVAWSVDAAGHKPATIRRRLSAISMAHKTNGLEAPTEAAVVRAVWRGIAREHGTANEPKRAISANELRAMVESCESDLAALRDRAMLLVGFGAALRRSELVALRIEDIEVIAEVGLRITIRRSKTDQAGEGRVVGIPVGSSSTTDAVAAFLAWSGAAGLVAGPVFRRVDRHGNVGAEALSAQSVALVVKARAAAVGIDAERVSGHSLRSGLATSAAAAGASERSIMAQTGHKSVTMARRYIQRGSVFRDNAAGLCL
jgi:site-specific recombinase XerD